jgi:enamine deaminase RidA (YjgF/YER057c/UK114 family)
MQVLNPVGIYHSPRYYSGVRAGHMIFTAGRVAKNPDGSVFAAGDTERQVEHIMECLRTVMAEGGGTLQDVVKVHTYVVDSSDWPTIHEIRQRYMGNHYPPHTGTEVRNLGSPDIRLEIEVTAVVGKRGSRSSAEGDRMSIIALNPPSIYNSPRYYSGVRAGNMIFTAGRVPLDLEGNVVAPDDARAQTARIMEDLGTILAQGGCTLQDVVFVHTYCLHSEDMPIIHEVRQRYMGDHYPPHTGTEVDKPSWVKRGIRVEIEVIAVASD